jgi:hypothetical protein
MVRALPSPLIDRLKSPLIDRKDRVLPTGAMEKKDQVIERQARECTNLDDWCIAR